MKEMNIVGIHGIHDDGNKGLDPIGRAVAKIFRCSYREPIMPVRSATACYWASVNQADADECLPYLDEGSVVIAHSRGCLLADLLMRRGRFMGTVVFLAPALPADTMPGDANFGNMLIVFNPEDKAMLAARFLPFHPFTGRRPLALTRTMLGQAGYTGDYRRHKVSQWDGRDIAGVGDTWLDHSNFWTSPGAIEATADALATWIRNANA